LAADYATIQAKTQTLRKTACRGEIMRIPESHHETDLALASIMDEREVVLPTPRSQQSGTGSNEYSQTDLKEVLNQSRRSEARLRKIIDTIPALAWCNLADGNNEFLNQRWIDYTGVSPEEALGSGWKIAIHPEDLPGLMGKLEAHRDGDTPVQCEARLRRFDGLFLWFLFRIEPLHDETGEVVRWYGTATAVEDRKRTESLRDAEKRLLEMIANCVELSKILCDLCAAIDSHAPGAASFVCLMDANGKQLLPCAGSRVPTPFTSAITPFPIGPNRGSCGTAAFTKQRVIIPNISIDPK
jgi:PAS domain S-box-containing protein